MKIDIINRTQGTVPISVLRRDAARLARLLGRKKMPSNLTIVCVKPSESRELKKKYLRKEKAANVLSFRYDEKHADIILTPAVIKWEAKEANVTFQDMLRRMLAHGTLHIAGLDHEGSNKRERQFEKQERSILSKLGIRIF